MNAINTIKAAVLAGHKVHWCNAGYTVTTAGPEFYIEHADSSVGLTWMDGVTLNGKPEEFYIELQDGQHGDLAMLDNTIDGIRILLQHGNRNIYCGTNKHQLRLDNNCIIIENLSTGECRKLTADDLSNLIYDD